MAFLHAVSSGHSATKNVLKGRSLTPYLLLAPGLIWLVTFFIIPIFSLASTSTMVRPEGAQVGVYEQSLGLQIMLTLLLLTRINTFDHFSMQPWQHCLHWPLHIHLPTQQLLNLASIETFYWFQLLLLSLPPSCLELLPGLKSWQTQVLWFQR